MIIWYMDIIWMKTYVTLVWGKKHVKNLLTLKPLFGEIQIVTNFCDEWKVICNCVDVGFSYINLA